MIEETVYSDLDGTRSPSALTSQMYRLAGFVTEIVERNLTPILKRDLFGFADHLSYIDSKILVFTQSTSASNHSARVKKVAANEHARDLCHAGHVVEVVSWKKKKVLKLKKDGTPSKLFYVQYEGRVSQFEAEDFTC
jgi:hypothetical protein